MIDFRNEDCMVGMARYPDDHFDLAIVDPPYFSGPEQRKYYGQKVSRTGVFRSYNPSTLRWSPPDKAYFDELMRVSRHYMAGWIY